MEPSQVVIALLIGLAAGVIGGLAGIGGSMIMLPGLALAFGYDDAAHTAQHEYMAAAMAVNVLVAIPATARHARHGTVRRELVLGLVPAMVAAIVLGVLLSNLVPGTVLRRLLAVFIAGYCGVNIYRIVRPRRDANRPPERAGRGMLAGIGGAAGLLAGLLGLGGGVVMVPMLQVGARVRLRQAIAASSAAMVASALIGAGVKFATLAGEGRSPIDAGWLATAMAPGAILGGAFGATLAHRLSLTVVRISVSVLLLGAAVRMML